jgi:hypothetical protein
MYSRKNPALINKRWYGIIVFGLLIVLSSSVAHAQSYGQCTASAFVNQISLFPGGTGTGLAIDSKDNVYIASNATYDDFGIFLLGSDPRAHVTKATPQGTMSIFVSEGVLGDVTGLAVDPQDNLYVADGNGNGNNGSTPRNMVWKVSPQGTIAPFISGINNPTGLAFDSAQNLYVASFADRAVYKYSTTGAFLSVVTSGLPDSPYGVAVDKSGNLFIAGFGINGADAYGTRIYKITPQGQRSIFVDAGFPDPYSLVFDRIGNLYASYYNSLKILRIAPDGSFVTFPGGCIDDDAANGLAIDQHGVLYAQVNGDRTTEYPAVIKLFGIVPEQFSICPLYDQTRSVKAGATFPIKLDLCDGNGKNLSSPSITVQATAVTKVSGSSGTPESPGNANPDNNFRFDSSLGGSGGYIFNLSTAGLSPGTYSLQFTVTGDPVTHSVNFGVK